MPRRARHSFRIAIPLGLLALLATPDLLLARAGGGEGYSGGRSSGGGGGDVGDLLYLLFHLLRLCYYYPYIGIPLLVLVVAFFWYAGREGKSSWQSHVIRKAHSHHDQFNRQHILRALHAADPGFEERAFRQRVATAFEKIQIAWSGQDLSPVRPFISDAVHERFSLQFDEQKALGYRNAMENIAIESITLTHIQSDEHFDELSVRISASANDRKVSLRDGKVLSTLNEPFSEIWTFLRRRGATTHPDKPGLIEGNCPNCGAQVHINQSAHCQHCDALLRSGQYDWVLAEITQEYEWQPSDRHDLPGVPELTARDKDFNVQELEDRASVIFWRRSAAQRLNTAAPLRKIALPSFCDEFDRRARSAPDQPRAYFGECAVGSVETLGILLATSSTPGQSAGSDSDPSAAPDPFPYDLALVEVKWSGTQFLVHPSGNLQRREQSAVSRLLLVLARKPGAQSNPDLSISSAHCPNCGAPESNAASPACEYCGVTLNDGSRAWTLREALPMSSAPARQLLQRLGRAVPINVARPPFPNQPLDVVTPHHGNGAPPPPPPAAALAWMIKMTCADGHVDDRERELLSSVASRHHVPHDRLDQMLAAAQSGQLDVAQPADRTEGRAHLQSMASIALADGKLTRPEYTLLREAGTRLGLSAYDVNQLIRRAKSDLYAQAKQQLREQRRNGADLPPDPIT